MKILIHLGLWVTLKNYTPFAKNPTLAKFFREIGYAEELGSGFIKIIENSYLYSGQPPIFEDKEMFKVTIPLLRDEKLNENALIYLANDEINGTLNDTLNGTLNDTLNGTLNDTLKLLKENPKITQKEISNKLKASERTIKRNIKVLKDNGYIERIGAKKNGYWKVNF